MRNRKVHATVQGSCMDKHARARVQRAIGVIVCVAFPVRRCLILKGFVAMPVLISCSVGSAAQQSSTPGHLGEPIFYDCDEQAAIPCM